MHESKRRRPEATFNSVCQRAAFLADKPFPMRYRIILLTACLVMSLGIGNGRAATDEALAKADGDLIGWFHFAGTARVTSDKAAVKLNQLAAMPESARLRDEFLQKLSTTPFRLFRNKLASGKNNDFSGMIRPLLDDLMREESFAEMRGPSAAVPEFMVAVHLSSDRAKVWHDNLAEVLSTWTGIPTREIKGDGFTGWELKKHKAPNLIRFIHVGDWVLFGWGQDELRLQPGLVQRIKTQKRPVEPFQENWLDVMMDWPTYMRYHPFAVPAPLPAKLPKMHLAVGTRTDYVRPKLVMQFPESLNLNLEPWKVPTNSIHNPIVSFTAVRGIAPWLSQLEVVRQTSPPSVPNQAFFWSVSKMPFDAGVAAPVPGASNYLAQVAPRLVPALDSFFAARGLLSRAQWTNHEVKVGGQPFVTPYLRAIHEPAGDFLMGGLMPPIRRTNAAPFPADLARQLMSQPNLVSYSWEINEERVIQWLAIHQLYLMDRKMQFPSPDAPGVKWLTAAKSKLGNCATEITQTGPNELTLLRNAPVGLTGFEMMMLENWIDAPGFPLDSSYPQIRLPVIPKSKLRK